MWTPPQFGLIQERYWPDEWKMLVCCLCLNLTTRKQMEPVVAQLFERWPTPQDMAAADPTEISEMTVSLGMQHKRAQTLIRFSREFDAGFKKVRDLHGVGKYAEDSHLIFALGQWQDVRPTDGALTKYWKHLHQVFGVPLPEEYSND
jgi:methyl-CpG-binding domain protein 4